MTAKKYRPQNLIGDAGEYLVGAVISGELGWIYRHQPIADIGIDGEIETINDSGDVTGEVIKVQIKSQSEGRVPSTFYAEVNDFNYWNLLAVPVIVCMVMLEDREVYWKDAKSGQKTKQSYRYDFGSQDRLTSDSKTSLTKIAQPNSINLFRGLWRVVRQELENIDSQIPHPQDPINVLIVNRIEKETDNALKLYQAIKVLSSYFEGLSDLPEEEIAETEALANSIKGKRNVRGRQGY